MATSNKYIKQCTICNKIIKYKTISSLQRAIARCDKCKECKIASKQLNQEKISKIIDLNLQEKTNRQISKELGISRNTVNKYLKEHNLKSSFCNQIINIIDHLHAKCSKCNEIKSINEFQFGRKGQKYEYKFSFCNICRKKQVYLNLNKDINIFLKDRFNRLRRLCKKTSVPFNLLIEDYINIYNKQKGLCFYTDEVMIWGAGNGKDRNSLSCDKIIPEKGYVKGNIVFCTVRINTCKSDLSLDEMKKWMPAWHQRIERYLNE